MANDFSKFNEKIKMDNNPLSNYLNYMVANRDIYKNWRQSNCTPCLYRKIRKENVNIDPQSEEPTSFSRIDKYVIAYGKSVTFDSEENTYIDYETNLPIQPEGFSKLGAEFVESIQIQLPFDERFKYESGDQIIFKFNDYIFRFQVDANTDIESYMGILYNINFKYVDKCKVQDLNQAESEPVRNDEPTEEYW